MTGQIIATGMIIWVGLGVLAIIGIVLLILNLSLFALWRKAKNAQAGIQLIEIVLMSFRNIKPKVIVCSRIKAVQEGLKIETSQLENHYLAGGRPGDVVDALVEAKRLNMEVTWERASTIDLAGQDILETVRSSTNHVTECKTVDAVENGVATNV